MEIKKSTDNYMTHRTACLDVIVRVLKYNFNNPSTKRMTGKYYKALSIAKICLSF